jgi:hypothetical protein
MLYDVMYAYYYDRHWNAKLVCAGNSKGMSFGEIPKANKLRMERAIFKHIM